MSRLPFSIFKRKNRRFFYVQFKNSAGDGYLPAVSTKQITESGAIEIAYKWLREGKPQTVVIKDAVKHDDINNENSGGKPPEKGAAERGGSSRININVSLSLRESLLNVKAPEEAEFICKELKRQGFLKAYVVAGSKQDVDFPAFLKNFWDYDASPYIREKLHKNHGIHRNYTKSQKLAVEKFWEPFFKGRFLGDIVREDIDDFIDSLDVLANANASADKKARAEAGRITLSAGRKNGIIRAGTIPLHWALSKGIIDQDIVTNIIWFSGAGEERQILSPEIVRALFQVEWLDERARLANMLASVTGLRAGEILGLRVQDLGGNCIYVRHSWNVRDKLKTPKNNRTRVVEVPFPMVMNGLLNLARNNPHGVTMDSYVFWAAKSSSKPIESKLFVMGLRDALIKIKMSKESAATYVFHGWRHFFTTYMISKLEKKLLKSQTGHLTDAMLDHYGGHLAVGDREIIRQAQQEVFGSLVPAQKMLPTPE